MNSSNYQGRSMQMMKYIPSVGILTTLACLCTAQLALTVEPQVVSPNAYKVPYLGLDGTFQLNQDDENSFNNPRNPKRIDVEKMDLFAFFSDAEGKIAIAKNCRYAYIGAAQDPKYYSQSKLAVWDLFELLEEEKQDSNCDRFKYLTVTAPQDGHMHVRYGDATSSLETLLTISNDTQPWTPTYCTDGKTRCGGE
jgi:hypothetical protein